MPGLPSDLLSFGYREAAYARLGPSKVLQPGVDLVNMADSNSNVWNVLRRCMPAEFD